ncbi:transposase [Komagataeibacter diospyri]|nr:transposase [Komagataeibacter diospyri]
MGKVTRKRSAAEFEITGRTGGDPWRADTGGTGIEARRASDDGSTLEAPGVEGMAATFSGKAVSEPRSALPPWRNCTPRLANFWWN